MANKALVILCGVVGVLGATNSVLAADDEAPINPAAAQELPKVTIIGTAPLPGIGLPIEQVPSNVQTAGAQDSSL